MAGDEVLDHLRARGDTLAATRVHRLAADRLAATLEAEHQRSREWPEHVHHSFVTRLLQRSRARGAIASELHQQLDAAGGARARLVLDALLALHLPEV